jgi:hypothetical protein
MGRYSAPGSSGDVIVSELRFQATVLPDGSIRPPSGIQLAPGTVEVTVIVPQTPANEDEPKSTLFADLAALAVDGPPDMAENHDFYAHGAPKGIDNQ